MSRKELSKLYATDEAWRVWFEGKRGVAGEAMKLQAPSAEGILAQPVMPPAASTVDMLTTDRCTKSLRGSWGSYTEVMGVQRSLDVC